MPKITPFLWFDRQAEQAVNYYVSVFPNSKVKSVTRYAQASANAAGMPAGSVMTIAFELDGQDFVALNGGSAFKLNEAVSFVIECEDQAEVDDYSEKLSAVPESQQCGWAKDRFGMSWQIVPRNLPQLLKNPRATAALMKMKKINIKALEEA